MVEPNFKRCEQNRNFVREPRRSTTRTQVLVKTFCEFVEIRSREDPGRRTGLDKTTLKSMLVYHSNRTHPILENTNWPPVPANVHIESVLVGESARESLHQFDESIVELDGAAMLAASAVGQMCQPAAKVNETPTAEPDEPCKSHEKYEGENTSTNTEPTLAIGQQIPNCGKGRLWRCDQLMQEFAQCISDFTDRLVDRFFLSVECHIQNIFGPQTLTMSFALPAQIDVFFADTEASDA